MRVSYSRVGTFKQCPYKFRLQYIDGLKTYPKVDDPANALILGHALHTGIEKDIEAAIDEYYNAFPIIDDMHVCEAIKLEYRLKQCKEILPEGLHETEIKDGEQFVGYIDLLVPVDKNTFDLYDFKYSNNVDNYMESEQLHVYKWYFEKLNPTKQIRNLYYLFVPKVNIRKKYKNKTNKRDETIEEFRLRIRSELKRFEPEIVQVDYDIEKVKQFLRNAKECRSATKFEKSPSRLCNWCDFQRYCESDEKEDLNIMNLPKNERTSNAEVTNRKIWIYGLPFSGKTYLANQFPDMLLLSTDGNYKQLPDGIPPHIDIKDTVVTEGRITKRTFAWDNFKDVIAELEKKDNDFKTIVVDLLEDTYEHCRLWCYDKLGIEHESDNSFKAWDYVKTEFLSTIKRLMNLDYENIILISHEDTSKDFTKKTGDKITAIKPNIQEKTALKLAGMVDIVVRIVNDDGERKISFKTSEVQFGGGRLNVESSDIPCSYDDLISVYGEVKPAKRKSEPVKTETVADIDTGTGTIVGATPEEVETATAEPEETETPEKPQRTRKPREVVEEAKKEAEEEKPVRRRRKRTEE